MKKRTIFYVAFALIALAIAVYVIRTFNFFSAPCPPVCLGYEEKRVAYYVFDGEKDTIGKREETTIRVEYECNEIVLIASAVSPERADSLRDYLKKKNFVKADSCACTEKLELWRYAGVGDADVIDVVKNPPHGTSGVGLNYHTAVDPRLNPLKGKNDSSKKNVIDTTAPVVKIAIVDTGVDISLPNESLPFTDPQSYLFPFLLEKTKHLCKAVPYTPFGLNVSNITTPLPADLNGHGTQVNGIIAGYPPQAGSNKAPECDKSVRFELLNIRFTRGDTKSGNLFDAVCGLYYALEQGAEVINISWGYLDDTAPAIMEPFLQEALDRNVVIVAGLGNDGKGFGALGSNNMRFWPAGFSTSWKNVISVGAADSIGNLAGFSNRGNISIMNVVAPGVDILSTFPKYLQWTETGLVTDSGTSFATPFVTRTVAVMIGEKKCNGKPSPAAEIKSQVLISANPNRNATVPKYDYHHDAVLDTW